MREMVFRERTEKVSTVKAIASIVARLMNTDLDKAFGGILNEYASEVFQESYDPAILKQKHDRLKAAQARVQRQRKHDLKMIERLDRMEKLGDEFEKKTRSPK